MNGENGEECNAHRRIIELWNGEWTLMISCYSSGTLRTYPPEEDWQVNWPPEEMSSELTPEESPRYDVSQVDAYQEFFTFHKLCP